MGFNVISVPQCRTMSNKGVSVRFNEDSLPVEG